MVVYNGMWYMMCVYNGGVLWWSIWVYNGMSWVYNGVSWVYNGIIDIIWI
jgi:hypothetical protein